MAGYSARDMSSMAKVIGSDVAESCRRGRGMVMGREVEITGRRARNSGGGVVTWADRQQWRHTRGGVDGEGNETGNSLSGRGLREGGRRKG